MNRSSSISRWLALVICSAWLLSACQATRATPSPAILEAPAASALAPTASTPTTPLPALPTATASPTSTPAPTATLIPTPAPEDILPAILAAFEAQEGRAWRYNSEIRMESGETHTTVFEYQPPDRYRIVSDGVSELVGIGGKVYQRDGGPWTESPVRSTTIVDPQFTNRLEQSIANLQFIGFETLNGVPMQVFAYSSSYKIGLSPAESQTRLWIGLNDGQIYQIVIDGQVAALDHSSGVVENTPAITTIVYEYDPGIQIEEPIVGK